MSRISEALTRSRLPVGPPPDVSGEGERADPPIAPEQRADSSVLENYVSEAATLPAMGEISLTAGRQLPASDGHISVIRPDDEAWNEQLRADIDRLKRLVEVGKWDRSPGRS